MKLSRALLIFALLPVLAACGSSKDEDSSKPETAKEAKEAEKKQPPPICPQVAILRELQEIKDYGAEKPDPTELVGQARMKTVDGDCGYQDNGIDVKFDLNMVASKGPRLGGLRLSFPYFVSVVDPEQNILNKEKMTAQFGFSSASKVAEHAESLHVFIPLPKDKRRMGPDYQVLIGFQLTKEQLDEVRSTETKELSGGN